MKSVQYKYLCKFHNKTLKYLESDRSFSQKVEKIIKLLEKYIPNSKFIFSSKKLICKKTIPNSPYFKSLIKYANKSIKILLEDTRKENELYFLAYYDSLTGFKNKNSLQKMLKTDIRTYSLLLLNVDNFSYVNTAYGCDAGDVILVEIAKMLKSLCKHDDLYRINADEFGIVYKDAVDMLALIKKIQRYFYKNAIVVNNLTFHVVFSYGGTIGKYTLFKKATVALKEAKQRGNNKYRIYNADEEVIEDCQMNSFVHWNNIIHNALLNSQLVPFFQGIYDEKLGRINSYEALVRIKHNDGYYVPQEFLESAKLSGMLPKITKMMIDKSFKFMSEYSYRFSINITEEDLEHNFLLKFLEKKSKLYGIQPERVTLEILENISSSSGKNHINQLKRLKKAGYKIAIDDFGTEYSNFERLLDLDIDCLKLDAKYIKNIDTDKKSQDIIECIVLFAKKNDIPCTAEFVHNEEVAKKVKALGIEFSQGYFYSKPSPVITELEHHTR